MDVRINLAMDDWVSGKQDTALTTYFHVYPDQQGAGKTLGIYFFFERTGVGYNGTEVPS